MPADTGVAEIGDGGESDAEQALLKALGHPFRKTLLKLCLEAGERRSPKELALATHRGKRSFQAQLSSVSYHMRTLEGFGALEIVGEETRRGSVEHFYRATSLVDDVPWGRVALGLEDRA